MNKCNVPKKKILVLSNNKFSQDSVIVYKKVNEWVHGVTTNDNEYQRMTVVQRRKATQCTSKNG